MKAIIIGCSEDEIGKIHRELKFVNSFDIDKTFICLETALFYIEDGRKNGHPLDFAIIDADLTCDDGCKIAHVIRRFYPDIILGFVIGGKVSAMAAAVVRSDFYLLRPLSMRDVYGCVVGAKCIYRRNHKDVEIQTFGRFELIVNDRVVNFKYSKAKELLALCVDNKGEPVGIQEIAEKLWEDRAFDEDVKQKYRAAAMFLRRCLKEVGLERIFESSAGKCRVNREMFCCDYYDFIDGDEVAFSKYNLAYMTQYSWAEETNGKLIRIMQERWMLKATTVTKEN